MSQYTKNIFFFIFMKIVYLFFFCPEEELNLPYEVQVSQQSQNVCQDAFHVPGKQRCEHVDVLQADLSADHTIQRILLCYL